MLTTSYQNNKLHHPVQCKWLSNSLMISLTTTQPRKTLTCTQGPIRPGSTVTEGKRPLVHVQAEGERTGRCCSKLAKSCVELATPHVRRSNAFRHGHSTRLTLPEEIHLVCWPCQIRRCGIQTGRPGRASLRRWVLIFHGHWTN